MIGFTVSGRASHVSQQYLLVATKIDLIRHGLVCGRPWWVTPPSLSSWTSWDDLPSDLATYSAAELLECRRVAVQLNTFISQAVPGGPVHTTETFQALQGCDRHDAGTRLAAAIAGQLAWSLFDVPALHHAGAMAPELEHDPAAETRVQYAGLDGSATPSWLVLSSTMRDAAPDGPAAALALGAALPQVRSIGDTVVGACASVTATPGADAEELQVLVRGPMDTPVMGVDLPGIDADCLDERRYAPIARAFAAEVSCRTARTQLPGGEAVDMVLLPLGFTGYLGVCRDVASAIRAGLVGEGRAAIMSEIREVCRDLAAQLKPPTARKVVNRRSRTTSRMRTAPLVTLDGVEYEVSVGADGIVLLLPAALTQMNTGLESADH